MGAQVPVDVNDTVFSFGDACSRCVFIERGKLLYTSRTYAGTFSVPKMRMQRGNWLSEAALWTVWQNTGELKSLSYGVVLGLGAKELVEAVKRFPRAHMDASIYGGKFVQTMNDAGCTDLGLEMMNTTLTSATTKLMRMESLL